MTRTWITPIYDRTYADVQAVQYNPDQTNPKGCWNATDLNRIEKNTAYCAEWIYEQRIVSTPPDITVRENNYWQQNMIPSKTEIDRICNNVRLLVELSSTNPAIANQLPTIYASTQPNYVLANQIEFALDLMHNQPRLPLDYFRVSITHGVVKSVLRDDGTLEIINSNEALVAEDEIVTIRGVEYGEDAQYQMFNYWSGQAADLALLDNYQSQETTFEMPWGRAIEFTANFETHIPRTLTITNGYISPTKNPRDESGPTTGTYYAGDEIMIIANIAASGKAFYEWTGTEAALDHITGVTNAEDPSTCILTMPDCDVNLAPHYINAGQHSVTVNGGSGGGWYNYKDYVFISANTPSHYAFSHWSGATSYLRDIYSASQSFQMSDVNISFTANFVYVYSYNDLQIIDGLIRINGNDVAQASNIRQGTSQTLVPTPPDNTQGIDYWSIEGYGDIETDYLGNQTNTFVVGDGNAIITGHYAPLRALTVLNINNNGGTSTSNIVQGRKTRITTNEIVGDYIFQNWTSGSTVVSTGYRDGSIMRYDLTMPSNDMTITTNYRLRNQVTVTINYGTHTETVTMQERASRSITADTAPTGQHFLRWDYSGLYSVNDRYASTTSFVTNSGNGTITAIYENDYNYHTLTVNDGTGSGTVREGDGQIIDATQAPATYEFDYWEINSGNGTIDNVYAKRTTFRMNTTDAEVTAHYKPIPYFTITMEDGYIWDGSDWVTSATLLRNSTNSIKMKPAPTGKQFLQWEVYVNGVLQTDANDVYEPLAEQTRLRDLLRDATLKATYYTPDTGVTYTLTITRKDGSTTYYEKPAGTDVTIHASSPDTGMEFYKWTGDTAYIVGGVTNPDPYVHMPAQNIQLRETYLPEGTTPEFKIEMTNIYGQCCYETEYTDPQTEETTVTEHWVSVYEHYKEGDIVKIRATGFSNEYYFNGWNAYDHDTEADMRSVITALNANPTTLTMPACDLDIDPTITARQSYTLKLNDGLTGGTPGQSQADYRENARADVYFAKTNTNDIHYEFTRWTGSTVSQIELYDGGMFDVRTPGTANTPQFIKMPGQNTEITATYKTKYKLTLVGGTIDATSLTEGFYENGTIVAISANTASSGMRFQYWSGDTNGVANIYDPTTTVTISGVTGLTAVYSTDSERNGIGHVASSLKASSTVDPSLVTIISGSIEPGFIITDSNGHVYVVTNVSAQEATIYRMTKIVEGGNIYG